MSNKTTTTRDKILDTKTAIYKTSHKQRTDTRNQPDVASLAYGDRPFRWRRCTFMKAQKHATDGAVLDDGGVLCVIERRHNTPMHANRKLCSVRRRTYRGAHTYLQRNNHRLLQQNGHYRHPGALGTIQSAQSRLIRCHRYPTIARKMPSSCSPSSLATATDQYPLLPPFIAPTPSGSLHPLGSVLASLVPLRVFRATLTCELRVPCTSFILSGRARHITRYPRRRHACQPERSPTACAFALHPPRDGPLHRAYRPHPRLLRLRCSGQSRPHAASAGRLSPPFQQPSATALPCLELGALTSARCFNRASKASWLRWRAAQ